jgi:hypothetical protein
MMYMLTLFICRYAKLSTKTEISIETLVTIRYVSNDFLSGHLSLDEGKCEKNLFRRLFKCISGSFCFFCFFEEKNCF